jgi:uncharacterized protein
MPLNPLSEEKNKEVGMKAIGSWVRKRQRGSAQALIWVCLASGLVALPLVAGSQNFGPSLAGQPNAWLQRYDQALSAYRAGDYARAYIELRDLADFGSAGAQTMLGHLYWTGKGVAKSHGRAFMWFSRAAERGYAPAQLALGRAYAQGLGTRKDQVRAAFWLSLAAERGAPSVKTVARTELKAISAGLSKDQQQAVTKLRRRWRPDVALMP